MRLKNLWPCLGITAGIVLILCGAGFVAMYVLEAVVARIGEPDQSLLFWYLPILFMGLIAMGTGVGAIVLAMVRLREEKRQVPPAGVTRPRPERTPEQS